MKWKSITLKFLVETFILTALVLLWIYLTDAGQINWETVIFWLLFNSGFIYFFTQRKPDKVK